LHFWIVKPAPLLPPKSTRKITYNQIGLWATPRTEKALRAVGAGSFFQVELLALVPHCWHIAAERVAATTVSSRLAESLLCA